MARGTGGGPGLALLLATVATASGCGGTAGCGGDAADGGAAAAALASGEPLLVRPDRGGLEHDLFVVTGGGAGQSFRLRFGPDRAPSLLASSLPAFYDGNSLTRFGRLALRRQVDLPEGGTFEETRVRLWEEDGLGAGRWVHDHGLFEDPDSAFGALCDPAREHCAWDWSSGTDLVSIVGDLRGMRRWAGGYTGGAHSSISTRYAVRDRFGHDQEFLKLWGPQHKTMIRDARAIWDALPEDETACYEFDYRSSYLRPAPGGLVWVMHGTPTLPTCRGTVLPIEVAVPPPQYGGIDVSAFGEPGDVFHFGPPDLWFEPGSVATARSGDHSVQLPGGDPEDPPVVAIHWMLESDIPEAHRTAVDLAFTEVHDLPLLPGPAPVVDGDLGDWAGAELRHLDQAVNVDWIRADSTWGGPGDASLAVGVRAAEGGWVVAVRVADDQRASPREGRRAVATDHLELWLRGPDGWVQLAILPGGTDGEAGVEAWALARSGEQERDLDEARRGKATAGVLGATTIRTDDAGAYQGLDAEVFLPAALAREEDGRVGLRVLFADADGGHELQGDLRIGTSASLADAWLVLEEER